MNLPNWIPPIISASSALMSLVFLVLNIRLNRRLSDRSASIEGHKQLIELNKQLIADPRLSALYDAHRQKFEEAFEDQLFLVKLEQFAYMKLNIFELVLSHLPSDRSPGSKVWRAYFEDSMSKCSLLRELLLENVAIYDPRIVQACRQVGPSTPLNCGTKRGAGATGSD